MPCCNAAAPASDCKVNEGLRNNRQRLLEVIGDGDQSPSQRSSADKDDNRICRRFFLFCFWWPIEVEILASCSKTWIFCCINVAMCRKCSTSSRKWMINRSLIFSVGKSSSSSYSQPSFSTDTEVQHGHDGKTKSSFVVVLFSSQQWREWFVWHLLLLRTIIFLLQ